MPRTVLVLGLALLIGGTLAACQVGPGPAYKVGDCVNFENRTDGDGGNAIEKVVVTCADPHDGEVFHVFAMPGATFPGLFAIGDAQQDECSSAFSDYVGIDWEQSMYTIDYDAPDAQTWAAGNHQIICTLVDAEGGRITGSAKDTAQ